MPWCSSWCLQLTHHGGSAAAPLDRFLCLSGVPVQFLQYARVKHGAATWRGRRIAVGVWHAVCAADHFHECISPRRQCERAWYCRQRGAVARTSPSAACWGPILYIWGVAVNWRGIFPRGCPLWGRHSVWRSVECKWAWSRGPSSSDFRAYICACTSALHPCRWPWD